MTVVDGAYQRSIQSPRIWEHNMRYWLAVAIGVVAPTLAVAQSAARPVSGELLTSGG